MAVRMPLTVGLVGRSVRSTRIVGALTGALISLGVALVAGGVVVNVRDIFDGPTDLLSTIGTLGIPAAALLGWIMGPRAVRAKGLGESIRIVIGMALLAVLIGDIETVGVLLAGEAIRTLATGPQIDLGQAAVAVLGGGVILIVFVLFGLVYLGWLALAATLPAAAVWFVIVRLVVQPRPASTGSVAL